MYLLLLLLFGKLPIDHLFSKQSTQFGNGYHMQIEHQINTFGSGLAIRIEEENSRIVDQHIYHKPILLAVSKQQVRCFWLGQIGIMRYGIDAILVFEVLGYFCQFLFLIGN